MCYWELKASSFLYVTYNYDISIINIYVQDDLTQSVLRLNANAFI